MPTTTPISRAYPKRKRTQVSYREDPLDFSESEEYNSRIEEAPPSKKAERGKAGASPKPLPKKIFPFLSLPPELRNKIYLCALTDNKELFLVFKLRSLRHTARLAASSERLPRLVPSILALNSQIFAETQPMLYGSNSFAFEDATAMHAFCTNIGPKNCATLKEIHLKRWGFKGAHKAMTSPAFAVLGNAVNLTRLYIDCQFNWWRDAKHAAQYFYRDAHYYLEAVGLAKGRRDAAVELIEVGKQNLLRDYQYGHWKDEPGSAKTEEQVQKEKEFQSELRRLLHA